MKSPLHTPAQACSHLHAPAHAFTHLHTHLLAPAHVSASVGRGRRPDPALERWPPAPGRPCVHVGHQPWCPSGERIWREGCAGPAQEGSDPGSPLTPRRLTEGPRLLPAGSASPAHLRPVPAVRAGEGGRGARPPRELTGRTPPGFPRSPRREAQAGQPRSREERAGRQKEDLRQCRREPRAGLAEVPRAPWMLLPWGCPSAITERGLVPAPHSRQRWAWGGWVTSCSPAGHGCRKTCCSVSTVQSPGVSPRNWARGSMWTLGNSSSAAGRPPPQQLCPALGLRATHTRRLPSRHGRWSSRTNPTPIMNSKAGTSGRGRPVGEGGPAAASGQRRPSDSTHDPWPSGRQPWARGGLCPPTRADGAG